jgi:ectoine hydroxylase-related dioxygenase (phytanoyl-CoA dioxygenase family)
VSTPAVPRVDGRTADVADVARLVAERGVCIVERLVDDATCDAVLDDLRPHLDAVRPGADDFEGRSTRRVGGILGRSPSAVGLVANELVLDVADRVLGPDKSTFQLHLTQAIAIGPDSPAQALHRDQWCFDFHAFPPDMVVEVSTIWALTDFTEATGATRVVPDSHRSAEVTATDADAVPAEMPRGSVVVYTGSTVHGGGANRSDETRVGLNVDYTLGWPRQEENQYLSVPIEVARTLPERVQRLMGYSMGSYALGYVDDLRDPISVLRPDRGSTGFTAG